MERETAAETDGGRGGGRPMGAAIEAAGKRRMGKAREMLLVVGGRGLGGLQSARPD